MNSVTKHCETITKNKSALCVCTKDNDDNFGAECQCKSSLDQCYQNNGTDICLCCTVATCKTKHAGSDEDLDITSDDIFQGLKDFPSLDMQFPKIEFPSFGNLLPSFFTPPKKHLTDWSNLTPDLKLPNFNLETHKEYFKNLMEKIKTPPNSFNFDVEDKMFNQFVNISDKSKMKETRKSETYSKQCFIIPGEDNNRCSCEKQENNETSKKGESSLVGSSPTASSNISPSCSCSAATSNCSDETCICCVESICKMAV